MKSPCHAVARKFKSSELTFKNAKLTCHVVAQNFSLYKDTSTERYTLPDHIPYDTDVSGLSIFEARIYQKIDS